jgi:hypothetical protein
VVAENLVKTYPGDVQAVKGISFSVQAGEAFRGFSGPTAPERRISDFDIPFGLMSGVAVPLCSNLVQLAALGQYQGEGDGEEEHTPALFLEAPYRIGKPLRDKLAGFHSARLDTH